MRHVYIIMLLLALAVLSCRRGGTDRRHGGGADIALYTPRHALGYVITGDSAGGAPFITVTNPWQGADSVTTRMPVTAPARRIVCMSSTHIAMLEAIGAADRVVGVSGLAYINSPSIAGRVDPPGDVGYEGNVDYERMVSLRPDMVLLYGVNGASSMEGKLRELGIPYMYVGDYLEESPLGKAEWVVALGCLTGRMEQAVEVFDGIEGRYTALCDTVAASVGADGRPAVMFNAPFAGAWYMPSADSYMARLTADAGGDYIYRADTGNTSLPIDTEQAYNLVSRADVWLNPGTASTAGELMSACKGFDGLPCVDAGRVYNNTRRVNAAGGNDYFESGIMHPDVILHDLINIFHPRLLADEDLVYYRQLQ